MSYRISDAGFSISTFVLEQIISKKDRHNIVTSIRNQARKTTFKFSETSIDQRWDLWSEIGIEVYLIENKHDLPLLRLVVNPDLTIKNDNDLGYIHYNPENIGKLSSFLNNILKQIGCDLTFENMTLSQVDTCVNVIFDDETFYQDLKQMLLKGRAPFSCYNRIYSNANKDSEINDLLLEDVSIGMYNKRSDFKTKFNFGKNATLPSGIMRIKVRLYGEQISKIAHKHLGAGSHANEMLLDIISKNCKEIMRRSIFLIVPSGIYMRYDLMMDFIGGIKVGKKIRRFMLYLVNQSCECTRFDTALLDMVKEFDLTEKNAIDILEIFEHFKINPLTLSNDSYSMALPGLRSILNYEESPFLINE